MEVSGNTMPHSTPHPTARDVATINRTFYGALWRKAHLERPDGFNTWALVSPLLPSAPARLELGPGLRPRLPIAGTHFIDMCAPAVERLNARGGIATSGEVGMLPFRDQEFDLVCAFDVIEHVEDDRRVFGEVSRVLKDDGVLIVSVPLHADRWTDFDNWVGHARRYEPSDLLAITTGNHLKVESSAAFGMQPANPALVKYGMWWLEHHPAWAMFWYNWVGMPLAKRFQKRLKVVSGLVDTTGVDEVVLVCRRVARSSAAAVRKEAFRSEQ
jgi:SAM-dependent methyltransferase